MNRLPKAQTNISEGLLPKARSFVTGFAVFRSGRESKCILPKREKAGKVDPVFG